jgi:hypothetical protein
MAQDSDLVSTGLRHPWVQKQTDKYVAGYNETREARTPSLAQGPTGDEHAVVMDFWLRNLGAATLGEINEFQPFPQYAQDILGDKSQLTLELLQHQALPTSMISSHSHSLLRNHLMMRTHLSQALLQLHLLSASTTSSHSHNMLKQLSHVMTRTLLSPRVAPAASTTSINDFQPFP